MKACIASLIAVLALTLSASTASAQEGGQRGLGVGAQSMLTSDSILHFNGGVAGGSITYDAGAFHIDGIFGLFSRNGTSFGLGGRFWYTIHGGGLADLSVGGGLGFADDDDGDGTDVHFEAGLKMRLFLVSNVALSATLGLGFIFEDDDDGDGDADDDTFVLAGQNVSGMGITYFF